MCAYRHSDFQVYMCAYRHKTYRRIGQNCIRGMSSTPSPPLTLQQHSNNFSFQLPSFLMQGMRWGAPGSSRRALTPRRVGAHPARVGARLRLDAPRQGGNGGGVGSAVRRGGGRGGGRLDDLPAPAGARRRRRRRCCSRRCRVNGGVVDACEGGCLFVPGGK